MKKINYNDKTYLNLLITVFLVLTIIFSYILHTQKIWTFENYSVIKKEDKVYELVLTKKEYQLIKENKCFYYKSKKYFYDIKEKEEINNLIIVTINLKNKVNNDKTLIIKVPKTKEKIINIIIENWRSN